MFAWLSIMTITMGVIMALFLILLAMPGNSEFRSSAFKLLGIGGAAIATMSPIDFIPDVIPVVGWVDDLGYLALGAACAISLYRQIKRQNSLSSHSGFSLPASDLRENETVSQR